MRIGIDISQLAYPNTGVSTFLANLVSELIEKDKENEYVLFFSSLRGDIQDRELKEKIDRLKIYTKKVKLPQSILTLLWNKFHIIPIETFIGSVDFFITSDWAEPPTRKAKKATILYDLVVFKFPHETSKKIVNVQKQKLNWVKKESSIIFCISKSTAKDAQDILKIDKLRLKILYPGI